MVHLGTVDSLLILLYFGLVLYIGFKASRKGNRSSAEYLLAGRSLTLPMFVATLVSTWYGGILGVGEFSYKYGISNWVVFGIPYYVFALVFALFLAEKVRATNLTTIPDKLHQSYDRRTAVLGGVLTFFLVTPAAYVLMLGVLIQLVFGIPLVVSVLISTFLTICYLYAGGFRSDVWTNAFEFVLMFVGFALIVGFSIARYGGLSFLRTHVPPLHLTWHGGNSWQFITVWFFIALWTLVDPTFHQRCYAARDGATARRGILVSIGFWFCFDFLTSAAGLYSRALLPGLEQPTYSYPMLAEHILPVVAKGLFYIGMLAAIMSTLSSLTLISAITVGKDIVGRLRTGPDREATTDRWTRIGFALSAVFSVTLAIAVPSVVNIWYSVGTCIIPGLLVPVLASYLAPLAIRPRYAFWTMLSGWLVSTASLVAGQLGAKGGSPEYVLGVEPMYPGLFVSLALWSFAKIADRRSRRPKQNMAL